MTQDHGVNSDRDRRFLRVLYLGIAGLLIFMLFAPLGCLGWMLFSQSGSDWLTAKLYPGTTTSNRAWEIRGELWERLASSDSESEIDWETIPEIQDEWGRPFRIHFERFETERLYALIESDGEPGGKHVWRFELFIRRNAAGEWERYHRDWWETDWTKVRPGASGLNDPIASEAIGAPPPID